MSRAAHRRIVFLRRRLAAAAVVAVAVPVMLSVAPQRTVAAPGAAAVAVTVVVGQGDTVWDLALPHAPAGVDPTVWVAQVVAANGVDAGALVPGSVLLLPQG